MDAIYLNQFEVILPKNHLDQENLLTWIADIHVKAEKIKTQAQATDHELELIRKLFHRYAVKPTQISQRYFECDDAQLPAKRSANDVGELRPETFVYQLSENNPQGFDILQRTQFFSERAHSVFKRMYDSVPAEKKPDHLIHVSCTGYISPSAPQRMIAEEKWGRSTDITHAYHMGCYAAMPAVRMAQGLVSFESTLKSDFKTDIVHTEMCGLHLNPLAQTPEQMIVQTLFADGHVKYTASGAKAAKGQSLKVRAILEKVIPNSEMDMSWVPASWGMQMNLSREVPVKIKSELKPFFYDLLKKAKVELADAMKAVFAVHPGGPKIIDSVQEILELSELQVSHSKKILFERGNMSSATLPHVWNEIIQAKYPPGTLVVSFAFGPGLTMFGALFEVCE